MLAPPSHSNCWSGSSSIAETSKPWECSVLNPKIRLGCFANGAEQSLETMDLTPGTYTLSCDVQNPEPDRRKSYDWTARALWQKGATYVVSEEDLPMPDGMPDRKVLMVAPQNAMIYRVPLSSPKGQAIALHLLPIEEQVSDWLRRQELGLHYAPDILDRLVAIGKLSRVDVEAAYRDCLDASHKKEEGP